MGFEFGKERFVVAVHGMASSPEPLQRRLAEAYNLCLQRVDPETDLPAELKPPFQRITERMTRGGTASAPHEVFATAAALDEDEAIEVALHIVHISDRLCMGA